MLYFAATVQSLRYAINCDFAFARSNPSGIPREPPLPPGIILRLATERAEEQFQQRKYAASSPNRPNYFQITG